MTPPEHLGEPAPWPFASARHAGHARLRRGCASLMGVAAVALLAWWAIAHVAWWAAGVIAS